MPRFPLRVRLLLAALLLLGAAADDGDAPSLTLRAAASLSSRAPLAAFMGENNPRKEAIVSSLLG